MPPAHKAALPQPFIYHTRKVFFSLPLFRKVLVSRFIFQKNYPIGDEQHARLFCGRDRSIMTNGV